jgi:hypothetical protein
MNIEKAQAARADKALNGLVRTEEYGVTTFREWMDKAKRDGMVVSVSTKPRIEFNRTKYNRMNGAEQTEYERKTEERVPCYKLHKPSETIYTEIRKVDFDYFNSL